MQQFRSFHLPSTQPWLDQSHTRIPSKPSTANSDSHDNSKDTFISISEVSHQPTLALGQPLHRFYFRSVVGVLGPIVVSAYFIIIWRIYLYPTTADGLGPLVFGPPGASYVFYSWFIAGVVGLNLSLYGLAGVEAAMLMEPAWNVGNAMTLMMHADRTWSGPGGWLKMVNWVARGNKDGGRRKWPGKLWWSLAVPSMLIFAAWPLSGLCLETTQGWLHESAKVPGANVTGFTWAGFNERVLAKALYGAGRNWINAMDARIPGIGIAYTPEGYDRSRLKFLGKSPNILPNDEGIPETFLTAQAETPIEGEAWGLLFQYNCSIVSSLSKMSILKDRKSAKANGIYNSPAGERRYTVQDNTSNVLIWNQTNAREMLWVTNLHAVIELGYRNWPGPGVLDEVYAPNPEARNYSQTDCYFNKIGSPLLNYPGIDSPGTFEVLLWQWMENKTYGTEAAVAQEVHFDSSIDHSITSLYGEYDFADFSYWLPKNRTNPVPRQPMTAIGLTCSASSSVGSATLLGAKSSYRNFTRTDTPTPTQPQKCARRFDALTAPLIFKNNINNITHTGGFEFLSALFAASNAPPSYYAAWTTDSQSHTATIGYQLQLAMLQAKDLKRSIMAAYASYAAQLMYNGRQGWSGRDGAHNNAITYNPNITTFHPGTVIKPGTLGVQIPLSLFVVWTVISAGLCAVYGFRRRWSAVLDGHTLFRLGVGLKESHRRAILETSSAAEVETCMVLGNLPGLVGDVEAGEAVGRIGLVLEGRAEKGRMYR